MEHEIKVRYDSITKAQGEVARLTSELRRMMESSGSSVDAMQDLQDQLTEARKSISENADELGRWANISAKDLTDAIDKAEFAVGQLNSSVDANREVISALEAEYSNASGGIEELTAKQKELQDAMDADNKAIEELERYKETLAEDSIASEETAGKITELKNRISEMSPKLDELDGKIKAKTDTMAETQKALAQERAALSENTKAQTQMQMTLDQTKRKYEEMSAKVTQNNERMKASTESFQGIAMKMFTAAGLGAGLGNFISKMQAVRAQMQNMEGAMATMLGADKAKGIMADLKQLATQSPLAMTDMVGAEKLMVSFGLDAKKSVEYIKALSDISGGESGKFNSLALAFSQMSASGKLMGQDLMQMINQGFNPLEEMSRKTGKSIKTLKDEMSKGAISAKMVQDAFMSATQEGGKFFGMSETGSKTINGQLSMLGDAWDNLYNSIGKKAEGIIGSVIGFTTDAVNNWQKLIPILVGVGAAYGVVKLAEIGAIEAEKELTAAKLRTMGVTISATAAEGASTAGTLLSNAAKGLATKIQWAYNAALSACPYVAVALGIAALGYWIYDAFIKETELEKAQSEVNVAFAEAELQTKKDTASLKHYCNTIEEATASLDKMNKEKGKSGDNRRATEGETEAVRDNSRAVDENTDKTERQAKALDKEKKKTEELNSAKGEIISLAAKYGITLSDEQLRVENLAATYSTLATEIERTNKAKALNDMKDSAEKTIASAKADMAKGMSDRFQSVFYDDNNLSTEQRTAMIEIDTKGRVAMGNILERIEKGELEFTDKQLNNWDNFIVTLGKKAESEDDKEDYKAIKDYFSALRQNSWREQKFDTSFDYLSEAIDIIQAQAFKVNYANDLAGEDARRKAEELRRKAEEGEKKQKQEEANDKAQKSRERRKSEELSLEKELYNLKKKEQDMNKEILQYMLGKEDSLIKQKDLQDQILEIEHRQAIEELKRNRDEEITKIKEDKTLLQGDKSALIQKTEDVYDAMIASKELEFARKAERQNMDFLQKQEEQLKGLLETYGDHYDKRKAILDKFAKERKKMEESGISEDSMEMINFDKAQESELKNLDKSYTFDDTEWKEALKVERYINKIADEAVAQGTEAMLLAVSEYTAQIQSDIDSLDTEIETAKKVGDTSKATELSAKRLKLQKEYNKAKEIEDGLIKDAYTNNGKASKQMERQQKRYEKTKKIIGLCNDALGELGELADENSQKWINMLSTIGDATLSIINSIQSYTEATTEAMKLTAEGAAESVKTVEKASVILAVIGAVIQAATKIAAIFSKGYDASELVSRWREVSSIYGEMASTQDALVSNARTAEDANKATKEQIRLINEQIKAEKQAIEARAKNRDKGEHSVGYKMNSKLSSSDWQSAFKAEGVAVSEWSDLLNLTGAQLKSLRENNAFLWSDIDSEMKSSLENIISLEESQKESAKELKDIYATITLDELKDSAASLFSNMNAQATDFSDTIKQNLKDSITSAVVEKEFAQDLESLQKEMAAAGENGVDKTEAASLMQKSKELQERINARKLELAEEYGESSLFQSEDDNTQTTGTFAEMSEATANALEGRFTAVYESNLRIESAVSGNTTILGTIAEVNSGIAETIARSAQDSAQAAQDTQRILAESLLELKGINENGGSVLKLLKSIAADVANVKDSTAKL